MRFSMIQPIQFWYGVAHCIRLFLYFNFNESLTAVLVFPFHKLMKMKKMKMHVARCTTHHETTLLISKIRSFVCRRWLKCMQYLKCHGQLLLWEPKTGKLHARITTASNKTTVQKSRTCGGRPWTTQSCNSMITTDPFKLKMEWKEDSEDTETLSSSSSSSEITFALIDQFMDTNWCSHWKIALLNKPTWFKANTGHRLGRREHWCR